MSAEVDTIPHGTMTGYVNRGCRCDECKAANTEYMRDYRAARKANGRPVGGGTTAALRAARLHAAERRAAAVSSAADLLAALDAMQAETDARGPWYWLGRAEVALRALLAEVES